MIKQLADTPTVMRGAVAPPARETSSLGGNEEDVPALRKKRRWQDSVTGWVFIGPAMLIILGLSIFPAAWALVLSLQKWNGFSEPKFIGVKNYENLFQDASFWQSVGHTGMFIILFVPTSVFGGLLLASALNRKIRFIAFYRTAIFVPFVVSAASTGILATYLFSPQFGLVNNVLRHLGLPAQGWLEDPNQAMIVIAIMSFWGSAAFTTVIYLAALQDIPQSLYEAARIDGASAWQMFWNITLPTLAPITVFVTVWQTISAIQLFDLVYTTTRGGPLDSTKTVVYFLWEKAFKNLEFGYGSAAAYLVFFVTLAATVAVTIYSRRHSEGN